MNLFRACTKNKIAKMVVVVFTLALISCKTVDTPNGEVPAAYAQQALAAKGIYDGRFEHKPATIQIDFDGHKPVLTFNSSTTGSDILGHDCGSSIGQLSHFHVSETSNSAGRLDNAAFSLNAGRCHPLGRELMIFPEEDLSGFVAKILVGYRRSCATCPTEYVYLTGRFKRR